MLEVSISPMIAEMKTISCEEIARKYHSGGGYYHEAPTYSETLAGKLDAIKKRVRIGRDCARGAVVIQFSARVRR